MTMSEPSYYIIQYTCHASCTRLWPFIVIGITHLGVKVREYQKEMEAVREEEEGGFQRKRSVLQHSSTSSSSEKDIEGASLEFTQSETTQRIEVITRQVEFETILQPEKIEKGTILPASYLPIPEGPTPPLSKATETRTVPIVKENEQGRQELYLERVYQKPPTHGFYCPNCKACIQTVYIQKEEWEQTEQIRCASCLSFLIPIGSWLFPSAKEGAPSDDQGKEQQEPALIVVEEPTEQAEPTVPVVSTPLLPIIEPAVPTSSKTWEILKSIVYGGLTESMASLSVVTSAASAGATTLNIVALAIANLIGGLFVLVHNLRELKAERPKTSENQTNGQVDRYNELLGQRENFILHASIVILSFVVFGLVPPVVYGFSFLESDDKIYKLAVVAVASLLCITLLSIAKAHIKRPSSYVTYFQTVVYYVSIGVVASVLSYLAGLLVYKLLEKLGWFEKTTSNSALQSRGIQVEIRKLTT